MVVRARAAWRRRHVAGPLRAVRDESEGYLDQRAAPCIQSDSTRTVPMLPRASGTQGSSEELHSTPPVYPSWDDNYGQRRQPRAPSGTARGGARPPLLPSTPGRRVGPRREGHVPPRSPQHGDATMVSERQKSRPEPPRGPGCGEVGGRPARAPTGPARPRHRRFRTGPRWAQLRRGEVRAARRGDPRRRRRALTERSGGRVPSPLTSPSARCSRGQGGTCPPPRPS